MNSSKFKSALIIGLALCSQISTRLQASDLPNNFENGEPADAEAVNENFRALEDAIDELVTGVIQIDGGEPQVYDISSHRYVVQAGPASVGTVLQIDHDRFLDLCADIDGCSITLAMLNWDLAKPGLAAAQRVHLFHSESSSWWRLDTNLEGLDGDSIETLQFAFDCYFTDAEQSTNANNGRLDAVPGFGLLNVKGGSYSDVNSVCRVVIED